MGVKTDNFLGDPEASDGGSGMDMSSPQGVPIRTAIPNQQANQDDSGNYLQDLNNVNFLTAELASLIFGNMRGNYRKLLRADFTRMRSIKKTVNELRLSRKEKIASLMSEQQSGKSAYDIAIASGNISILRILNGLGDSAGEFFGPIDELNSIRDKMLKDMKSGKLKQSSGSNTSLGLEDLLEMSVDKVSRSRIEDLLADKMVNARFEFELNARKEKLEIFEKAKPFIVELKKYESIKSKAKSRILEIKINAFRESRKLNSKEVSYIDSVRKKIKEIDIKVNDLLSYKEIAIAHRMDELLGFKSQFDKTGFVRSASRDVIIEEIQDAILLGKNVLLTGATGTGKTVLAVEAVKEISRMLNVGFESISGTKLNRELSSSASKKEFDDFVEVFSGTPDAKASDFIAKQRLRSGPKGGTETYTEVGKILKAFIDQKIPIIDEIDLIPNDTLMRMKHLFTKRPGDHYSPQEDGNVRYLLKSVNLIATANIKSAKHPNREEIDPAIIRLFKNIHVNYLPEDEVYDLALMNIMDPAGFIHKVSIKEIESNDSALARLIHCLKEVEMNYLGIGAGLSISTGSGNTTSVRDKQYLKKAVLELGRFVSMFSGFASSGLGFSEHIKKEVMGFISNMAYPKSDRLILLRIFYTKGFVTKKDIAQLAKTMDDISQKEYEDNILMSEYEFENDSRVFIDPYELACLDAFNVRNLNSKQEKFSRPEIFDYLIHLDRFLHHSDLIGKEGLEQTVAEMLDSECSEIPDIKKMQLIVQMYELSLKDKLIELKSIPGFEEFVSKIIYIDFSRKKLFHAKGSGDTDNPADDKQNSVPTEKDRYQISGCTSYESADFRFNGSETGIAIMGDGRRLLFIGKYLLESIGNSQITETTNIRYDEDSGQIRGMAKDTGGYRFDFLVKIQDGTISAEKTTSSSQNLKIDYSDWNKLKAILDAKYDMEIDKSKVDFEEIINGKIYGTLIVPNTNKRVPFFCDTIFFEYMSLPIKDTRNLCYDGRFVTGEVLLSGNPSWQTFKGDTLC